MVEHENPLSRRYPHDSLEYALPDHGPINAEALSNLTLAASGVKAVLRILVASAVEEDCEPSQPLERCHVGGLLDAAQALAAMLDDGLDDLGESLSRMAKDESERRGARLVWRVELVPARKEVRHG